jgi:hypothetical protein
MDSLSNTIINTREDLEALVDTPAYYKFLDSLRGTLWRLEKDDVAKTWVATEDNTTIVRFGFTRAAFVGAVAPALPVYVPPPSTVPQTVTRFQARMALLNAGRLDAVNDTMADPATDALTRMAWLEALTFRRDSPTVAALAALLELDAAQLDALFVAAEAITA